MDSKDSELSLCKSTTSVSNVVGGLASFMMNYIKMKFPKDMFKETYVANSMNANLLSRNMFHIQKLPYIGMEVTYQAEDGVMGTLPLNHNAQYYIAKRYRDKYYRLIFEDEDEKVRIYAIPDRVKVTFNFMLKFQSQMSSIDMMYYFKNNFELNGMNYVNGIRLPIDIPDYFIYRIKNKLGWGEFNEENNEKFRKYMRSFSADGIHEVVNQTTGNKVFRYEYLTNVLLSYPQEATSDNVELNLVVKESTLSFSIDAEIWTPSAFVLEIQDNNLLPVPPQSVQEGMKYTFDIVTIRDRIPKRLENGFYMIDNRRFVAEVNKNIDVLEMESILSKDIKNVIEALSRYKYFAIENIFRYKLYANSKLVPENEYSIDYEKHTLTNNNPQSNVTYTLVLYGDMRRLNEINDLILSNKRYKIHKVIEDIINKVQEQEPPIDLSYSPGSEDE